MLPSCHVESTRTAVLNACIDVGACQLIIDGKIKLKNDSQIAHFTKNGLKFEDGSEIEADVVLCATGSVTLQFFVDYLHLI